MKLQKIIGVAVFGLICSSEAFSQGYAPPSSKPLYESNGEVGEKLQFPSGMFLGGALNFGQSRHAGSSDDPRVSYAGTAEFGYAAGRGSWSRIEASLEGFAGEVGNDEVDMPIKGLMAKVGTGHSIGHNMYALMKVGAGLALADFEQEVSGVTRKSDGSVAGLAMQASYSVLIPMAKYFHITGGVKLTHYQFKFEKLKVGSAKLEDEYGAVLNVPEVSVGVRIGI